MKPICVKCGLFFTVTKNGYYFEEGMPLDGTKENWGPYKLWSGDLWRCRGCGVEIVVGVGTNPLAEHFQQDYSAKATVFKPNIRINDC